MKKIFIGIDFSKEKFDATVIKAEGVEERAERQHEVFDNKVSGFRRLLRWVKSVADEPDAGLWLFCGENTGGYSRALCNYLYGSGYDMWLENALSIKRSYALQRVKSDKADAGVIAEYAMRNYDQMRLYKPLGKDLERLREVFLYRHNLVKQETLEKHLKSLKGLQSLDCGCFLKNFAFDCKYEGKEDIVGREQVNVEDYYNGRSCKEVIFNSEENLLFAFFFQLNSYLKKIGTIPAIDINAYLQTIGVTVDEE